MRQVEGSGASAVLFAFWIKVNVSFQVCEKEFFRMCHVMVKERYFAF